MKQQCGGDSSLHIFYFPARVVELVDTRDLKSLGGDSVPVRVRPRAPFIRDKIHQKRGHLPSWPNLARNSLNGWSDLLGAPQSRNSISRIRTPFLSAKITENDEKDLIYVI